MKNLTWYALAVLALPVPARAGDGSPCDCPVVRPGLAGQVIDYTHNHGRDRRIYSAALGQKRDLYVYLPPGFDPKRQYPLIIFLHGYAYIGDESTFLNHVVCPLDRAIRTGQLPPIIAAAPDGTLRGKPGLNEGGSFFINSNAGKFQDWIVNDLWAFLNARYPIRPEPEAHVLVGASMGGFGAYNIAMKHRDRYKVVVGILPALNVRWIGAGGDYMADFSPQCWGWRQSANDPREVVGRFMHGLIKIRLGQVLYPLFGRGPDALQRASLENPIEMIDRYRIGERDLEMYIAYAGRDEFNLDAHAESFIYLARSRGIQPVVRCDPQGKHSTTTAVGMIPDVQRWLGERLRSYRLDKPSSVAEATK